MSAQRRYLLPGACALLAVACFGASALSDGPAVHHLDNSLLGRVRGRNINSGAQSLNLACATLTYPAGTLVNCGGVINGTECSGCKGTVTSMTILNNTTGLWIQPSGAFYLCANLNQFTGTCQNNVCTGNAGQALCKGKPNLYVNETQRFGPG